jgi:hypothetical protein
MSHPESAKVQKLITPEAVCQTLLEMVDIRSLHKLFHGGNYELDEPALGASLSG